MRKITEDNQEELFLLNVGEEIELNGKEYKVISIENNVINLEPIYHNYEIKINTEVIIEE